MAGISLAPGDVWNDPAPDWTRIDTSYNVQAWSIDRGRQNEMSRTDTGQATVELVDRTGDFDPTNTTGVYYGLAPLTQAKIKLQNQDTNTWSTLFRGFVSSIVWTPYRSLEHANVTLELVDGLALLAACEMVPNGDFGDSVESGNIAFDEDLATNAIGREPSDPGPPGRIHRILDQAGWPATLRSIFTGNVGLWGTPTYAPRSTVLSVIQDCANAEFPDAANVYISGPRGEVGDAPPGSLTFHGRFARFNPEGVQYDIRIWQAGDDAAAAGDSDTVRISPPLVASLDDTLVYTSAIATNSNIVDANIAGQYVTNTAALDGKGVRTWSAKNLWTAAGDAGRTAEEETRLFAQYVVDNYATPRVRVGQLTVKARRPDSFNGAATWALLCGVDLSDIVHLTTTHGGGGGFNDDFYVEGIHYTVRPGGAIPYVELTLDVSPRGYYDEPGDL